MTQDLYNRITTALEGFIADTYDAKLPDVNDDGTPWKLTVPVIIAYSISDVPTNTIDGMIAIREQRITCEVQALDIGAARVIKEALIVALHGWRGTLVKVCIFENGGPELYDAELIPPRYCLPVDFMLTF